MIVVTKNPFSPQTLICICLLLQLSIKNVSNFVADNSSFQENNKLALTVLLNSCSKLFLLIFTCFSVLDNKQKKTNVSQTRVGMVVHAPKWMMGSNARVQQNTKDQHVKVTMGFFIRLLTHEVQPLSFCCALEERDSLIWGEQLYSYVQLYRPY